MAFYDTSRLLEDANMIEYIKENGIEYRMQGSRMSIHCPDHMETLGKEDKNFGNCMVSSDGKSYYCYACHKKGDIFSLDQHVYGHNFNEACQSIANFLGDSNLYIIEGTESKKEPDIPLLPFTNEELSIIGLLKEVRAKIYTDVSVCKNSFPSGSLLDAFYNSKGELAYASIHEEVFTLVNFFNTEPENFYNMIYFKTIEKIEYVLKILKNNITCLFFEKDKHRKEFEAYLLFEYDICQGILAKYGQRYEEEPVTYNQKTISRFA